MKHVLPHLTAVLAMLATSIPIAASPAMAQAESSKPSKQLCMSRMTRGRDKGDKSILVVVSRSNQAAMESRGFGKVPCKGNTRDHQEYMIEMCKFAQISPADVQADFKRVHGATPTEFCQASK